MAAVRLGSCAAFVMLQNAQADRMLHRGQWYRVRLNGADVISVELLEAAEFPTA